MIIGIIVCILMLLIGIFSFVTLAILEDVEGIKGDTDWEKYVEREEANIWLQQH